MRALTVCAPLIGLLLLWAPARAAAQAAVLPSIVIADSNGDPIGPVVGFQDSNSPIIRVMDTAMDLPVFLRVRQNDWLTTVVGTTYFSLDSCTGTVYHPVNAQTTDGLYAVMGFTYSVARLIGGNQRLFRTDLSQGTSNAPISSVFNASDQSCNNDDLGSQPVRTAAFVLDLDAAHPPPYQILP